ncbi:hypothetical protein QCA50_017113 [Cerrena zonata]|uniref:Urea carboxylase n=1 Tax=Cerrena zonata TaxID=2478898 RepID=A0AAW0FLB3_9APHY
MSEFSKIGKVLIANRGEIACRTIRCCKENNLKSIAIFSSDDADSAHVIEADESHLINGSGATAYLDIDQIVQIAVDYGADVVVPGYGFLSENPQFAEELSKKGIVFAGPSSESVNLFGLKHSARELAEKSNVPIVPGSKLIESYEEALKEAERIGFPVMIKSTAGGGGMGLKVVNEKDELQSALNDVISRGKTLFKNSGAYLEKYIEHGRHIEVQIFGNGQGDVVAFGERECSIQRRHQKVIEEAPSPFVALPSYNHLELRKNLSKCAIELAASIKYKSAGTVEFLVDDDSGDYYFLEMNTRLQVEHGITELIYGVDLMKLMLLQAEFEARNEAGLPKKTLLAEGSYQVDNDGVAIPQGWAIECRIYAENPAKNFQPSPGILHNVDFPQTVDDCEVRIDHWISTGNKVSPYFDPLLAKAMILAPNRAKAIDGMIKLLQGTKVQGPPVNIDYLSKILSSKNFQSGYTLTSFLNKSFKYIPPLLEILQPGAYTSIQDLPGRESYSAGIPLSGPVDPLFLQLANLIVGNDRKSEALEITFKGPTIKFHSPATICLAGGKFKFRSNGKDLPMFTAITIPADSTIKIGDFIGQGARAYLAIRGGLPDVASYLGSKSCTPTLNLGGHQGRVLMNGDCLAIKPETFNEPSPKCGFKLPSHCIPSLESLEDDHVWTIRMLSGPHDTPEICSKEGLDMFYNTVYRVNLNSNRGCTKLDGPGNVFSRKDGGDGGSHPSNILEYPYPTCGLSIVGSVVSLFGVDGGTLSGFTCICTPAKADWWKIGQAKIGAGLKFKLISYLDALRLSEQREKFFVELENAIKKGTDLPDFTDELDQYENEVDEISKTNLYHRKSNQDKGLPEFTIRQAGENMILTDFGIGHFTLLNNGRQKALEIEIDKYDRSSKFIKAIIRKESCTGSTGFLFNSNIIDREEFIEILANIESKIPPPHDLKIKSTLYRLPCCFNHSALKHCMERYMHSQRPYAPYLPDNIEYVRKANCIDLFEKFKANVIGQTQVVTAVSFFCGNTLAVNMDPRTRFKTGKFNPARTFTPKGSIGSGSVGNSIYSIDSPGGYMIWGMTLPDLCWKTFGKQPWYFNNFDQIIYYEVDEEQLNELNNKLITGKLDIQKEEVEFDFKTYDKYLKENHHDINKVNEAKIKATSLLVEEEEASHKKWLAELEAAKESAREASAKQPKDILNDPNTIKIKSNMAANIFKINFKPGSRVKAEDTLIILEAMKMEIAIKPINDDEDSDEEEDLNLKSATDTSYEVLELIVEEGDVVGPGDTLALIRAV